MAAKTPRNRLVKQTKVAEGPLERACKGDESALPEVREMFNTDPRLVEIMGNLSRQAEVSWAETALGKNLAAKEGVRRYLRKIRCDLGAESSTPLERLLIERIAVCWLHLQYAELIYVQNMGDLSLHQAEFQQRRIDRAQKRFLAAIKALAVVRRLQLPLVQVNIAEKQMNVVAPNRQLPGTIPEDERR